jgi:hypothetical protein
LEGWLVFKQVCVCVLLRGSSTPPSQQRKAQYGRVAYAGREGKAKADHSTQRELLLPPHR